MDTEGGASVRRKCTGEFLCLAVNKHMEKVVLK